MQLMMIEYEKVVADYLGGLELKLRGASSSTAFLEMWVHDEDDAKSLLNMAESAAQYGLTDLSIQMNLHTYERIDPDSLLETLRSLGKAKFVKDAKSVILQISFAKGPQ